MDISVRKIEPTIGAVITGVDLPQPLSSETFDEDRYMHRTTICGDVIQ